MQFLENEIREFEEIGRIAYQLIIQGEFRNANRRLRKLKNSSYASQAERIRIPLEALMLQYKGQRTEARELIKLSISYLWSSADAFALFRSDNPLVTPNSKLLKIEILGGDLAVGMFACFNHSSIATVEVIAEDEAEGIKFIDELLCFCSPQERTIVSCTQLSDEIPQDEHKGVTWLLPVHQIDH